MLTHRVGRPALDPITFMYAPAQIDPLAVPSAFWKLVFAAASVIAAVWAIGDQNTVTGWGVGQ